MSVILTSQLAAYRPSHAAASTLENDQNVVFSDHRVRNSLRAARAATFSWDFRRDIVTVDDPQSPLLPFGDEGETCALAGLLARFVPADRAQLKTALESAASTGRSVAVECRSLRADGSTTWLEARALCSLDGAGGEHAVYGAFVDVSTQKALEAELRRTHNHLQTALQAGSIGTQVWDMQTGETVSDEITDRILGVTSRELVAMGPEAFLADVHPDDRPALVGHFAAAYAGPCQADWQYRYRRRDGSRVWVSSHTIAEHDDQGRPWRLTAALVDMTELKVAEQRLKLQGSAGRTLELSESLEEATASVIRDVCECEDFAAGAFWRVRPEASELECVATWVAELPQLAGMADALQSYALPRASFGASRVPGAFETVHWHTGTTENSPLFALAERHALTGGAAYALGDRSQLYGVLTFFSRNGAAPTEDLDQSMRTICQLLVSFIQRRRAVDALTQLNLELEARVRTRTKELEDANKELESFSYTVSHDLRTPLRTVDGFAAALALQFAAELPAEAQRLIVTIREGAQRMGTLIDDLLSFSRLGRTPLRKRDIDVEELARECLESLAPQRAGRDVRIEMGPLPVCSADRALLRQVWMNLLSNAIKYSSKRDVAMIELGVIPDHVPVYYVRDNGTGFDMRYANKLFGVFRRLHRADEFEGTGVGLAIVQRIVQRHGGRIWAEAARDRGATFFFTIEGEAKW